jgi:acyl-ACP thioesterase
MIGIYQKHLYAYSFRTAFSQVGGDWTMTLPGVVDALQNAAVFHAMEAGSGLEYLKTAPTAWIVLSWKLDMSRYPSLGEEVLIRTWATQFKSVYGYRNFEMESGQGELLGKARSLWVFFNHQRNRPQKLSPETAWAYGVNPLGPEEETLGKLELPPHMEKKEPFSIRIQDLDTNQHVNNARFIQMCTEYLPHGAWVTQMEAHYKHSARRPALVIPRVCQERDQCFVLLESQEGAPHVRARFQLRKE